MPQLRNLLKIDLRFSLLEDYLQRLFDLVDKKKPQPAAALRRSVSPSGKSEPQPAAALRRSVSPSSTSEPQPAAAVRRPVSPSGKSEPKQLRTGSSLRSLHMHILLGDDFDQR